MKLFLFDDYIHISTRVHVSTLEFAFTSLLGLIKRRSKVQEKKMSCERALNFEHWKTFSENYKPMSV